MSNKEALWQAYSSNRTPAQRNAIAEQYLYLAQAVARRFIGRGVETEDLIQVAYLALLHAVERFDAAKGLQFTTFAVPTIAGEVRNYLRDKGRLVRLPRRESELLARVAREGETFFRVHGREPSVAELSELLKETPDMILSALEAHSSAMPASLDAESEDGLPALSERLGADEKAFDQLELEDEMQSMLRRLSEPMAAVLHARYVENKSQREVAAMLGVSQMQISRLERKAIGLLRQMREENE